MTHPLLLQLPPAAQTTLGNHIEVRHLNRGAILFHQGAPAHFLHFIDDGVLQFRIDDAAGHSTFIGIAKSGDYLGDCELLADTRHFAIAMALTDCTVSLLPRSLFLGAMAEHADFALAVAQRLARSLHLMQLVQVARHQLSAEQNIAAIIIYLARHFGTRFADGRVRVDVALSQDQLADMAGVTRQSIHKPLQAWKNAGWIDYHYGNLVIQDRTALMALITDNALLPA